MNARQRRLLRLVNLWPPFLGAGIRVRIVAEEPLEFESRLRLGWSNRNWVGTHFGGSLYAMCDPFYMILLAEALGPQFVVWDKSATIRYLRPGGGTVRARFAIPAQRIAEIRAEAETAGRAAPRFDCEVLNEAGERVAVVEKVVSVRYAPAPRAP